MLAKELKGVRKSHHASCEKQQQLQRKVDKLTSKLAKSKGDHAKEVEGQKSDLAELRDENRSLKQQLDEKSRHLTNLRKAEEKNTRDVI